MSESAPRRRAISPTFTLFLVLFVVSVGFGLIIPILPLLTRDFGASPFALGAMTSSYSVLQFIFSPIWGQISDRFGRKRVLMVGIVGTAISFFMMGFADSFAKLFWARVLGGLLSSATLPSAQALAAESTSDANRSRAMGLMGAAFGTGFIVGPLLGGVLAPFGFAVPFFAGGAFAALTVVLAATILREPERRLAAAGGDGRRPFSLVRNIVLAFRGPGAPYYTVAFALMFAQSCLMTSLAYFLTDRFGAGIETIGAVLAANGAIGAGIQGVAIGHITERLGEHRTILIGLGIGVTGLLGLVVAPSLYLAVPCVMLMALSMALTRPSAASALSKVTTLPQGITMGVQSSFDSLGRVVGPLWAGYMYGVWQGAPFLSAATVSFLVMLYMRAHTRSDASDPTSAIDPGSASLS